MHRTGLAMTLSCALASTLAGCGDDGAAATTGGTTTGTTDTSTTGVDTTATSTTSDDTTTSTSTTSDDTTGSVDTSTTGTGDMCNDDVLNGDESDVDCGGTVCEGCEAGQSCNDGEDCQSGVCEDGVCRLPNCTDEVHNQDETDVDCGGTVCDACGDNLGCQMDSDCVSGKCINNTCNPAGCMDGLQNGNETDVDCGGATCMGCEEGGMCLENEDCATLFCDNGTCTEVECVNNQDCSDMSGQCVVGICNQTTHTCEAQPAFEGAACNDGDNCTQATCGGGLCGNAQPVDCSFLDGECSVGACNPNTGSCFEQALNDGDPCEDNDVCTTNTTCGGGQCGGGDAVDCSFLDTGCQVGVCNQFNGNCEAQTAPNGTMCDDGFACSTGETCQNGACIPINLTPFFTEDFADNSAGWTLDTEWEIGSATMSNCTYNGQDPAMDHTATMDNGVAGVNIGGCAQQVVHPFYCLTSPVIDTTAVNGPLLLDFWRHLHSDYTPYMQNTVEVFDGNAWVQLWASGSFPGVDDPAWTEIAHEVSNFAGPDFQVRFCFNIGSGGVFNVASWNVDDVSILSCP